MAHYTPLHDRVLVKRVEETEVSTGGIIIPDSAKEKPQEGEVIAVGPGRTTDKGTTIPMSVKPGDRILFGKYAGTEFQRARITFSVGGEDLVILREEEVLAIVTPAGKTKEREAAASRR